MKLKKGKVYPSPSPSPSSSTSAIPSPSDGDFLAVLKLLPAAILALASVLSLEDREVLAYMITRSLKPTTPSPITHESKRKNPKKSLNNSSSSSNKISNNTGHKPPMFDCDCFDCYTSYWFRWDSSPNRELIHQVIEAFEDHLAHGEQSKKVNGRGKRREKLTSRRAPEKSTDVSETPITPEIEESLAFSVTSPEHDGASSSWTEKGDVFVEESGEDKNKEHEVAIEEVVVEKKEEEKATVVETAMVAAGSSNNHKGLARKVLPDVLGLLNSRLWSLWNPNA